MASLPFIDTNVLVYAFADAGSRRDRAQEIVAAGGTISVQVLNEFVHVARRKLRQDWPAVLFALDQIAILLDPPLPLTLAVHRRALDVAQRRGYGVYDSLLLGAAHLAGCRIFYSEDMRDGQVIDGLRIVNPFRPA